MNHQLEDFVIASARKSGYFIVDFISKKRTKHLVTCRHRCWMQLYELGFSEVEIAEVFGRDCTSIKYVIVKHRRQKHYESIREKKGSEPVSHNGRNSLQDSVRRGGTGETGG